MNKPPGRIFIDEEGTLGSDQPEIRITKEEGNTYNEATTENGYTNNIIPQTSRYYFCAGL